MRRAAGGAAWPVREGPGGLDWFGVLTGVAGGAAIGGSSAAADGGPGGLDWSGALTSFAVGEVQGGGSAVGCGCAKPGEAVHPTLARGFRPLADEDEGVPPGRRRRSDPGPEPRQSAEARSSGLKRTSRSADASPQNYADIACKVTLSPYNLENPSNDPLLVSQVAPMPGRSFDSLADYDAVSSAPDIEILQMDSGTKNEEHLGNGAKWNWIDPFFFWFGGYRSMYESLSPGSDGLGMDWLYLTVASPGNVLARLEREGKRDDGSASEAVYGANGWNSLVGDEPDARVRVVLALQPFAVYQVTERPDEGKVGVFKVKYWVGVTIHPSLYPDPDDLRLPNGWNEDDCYAQLLDWSNDVDVNPGDVVPFGGRAARTMSTITGLKVKLVSSRTSSKHSGFPANARFYPAGLSDGYGEDADITTWTADRTFPYPLYQDRAGVPILVSQYCPRTDNPFYVGLTAVQTTGSTGSTAPGKAISYLGNMWVAEMQVGINVYSEWTKEQIRRQIEEGFECLFGDEVLCSVKVGYVPSSDPDTESPYHVRYRKKLRAADLVEKTAFQDSMAELRARWPAAEYIYNFGDSDSM